MSDIDDLKELESEEGTDAAVPLTPEELARLAEEERREAKMRPYRGYDLKDGPPCEIEPEA